ncbi:MAG: phosphotransferase family protein [Solirubrobacterales bacterium]
MTTKATAPQDTADQLVDLPALTAWMDDQQLGGGSIDAVEPLSGGSQNVMLHLQRGGRSFVLRRGPLHPRPGSAEALRREIRVLGALAGSDVPHPTLLAACPDDGVLEGGPFFLMELVDGFNPMVELPPLHRGDAAIRREMGYAAVDALAALGAVDHRAVGLEDFGRPDGFLERQIPRWRSELESYSRYDGYAGFDLPALDLVASWLEAQRPSSFEPGIMHGDFHLANLMYSADGPRVVAVVDWEMSTVADPLLDLGWLLAGWPRHDRPSLLSGALADAGGLPSVADLAARYSERSERDLSRLPWYVVMACFKFGIVLEGTYARSLAGQAPAAMGRQLHGMAVELFERAVETIKEDG